MSGPSRTLTLAAGGVLWRQEPSGPLLIALVHRPRYDDWTLPKGKLERGESSLLAAVRELAEETGARVQVGARLGTIGYRLNSGPKSVTYWSMRYLGGSHQPGAEVDAVRWLEPADALDLCSYASDREVLARFLRIPLPTSAILLVRHAKAGQRENYTGEDRLRPLDKIGRRQASDMVAFAAAFGPTRILSADRVRCEQTVGPLADYLGLAVETDSVLSDEFSERSLNATVTAVRGLLRPGAATLLCSQGGTIPALLDELKAPITRAIARKGSLWVLSFHGETIVAADYYPKPQA